MRRKRQVPAGRPGGGRAHLGRVRRGVGLLAARAHRRDPLVLAFQLKLNPHVCWSHPADEPCVRDGLGAQTDSIAARCPPPELSIVDVDSGVLTWERSAGAVDWDYGWDLCCSLYRVEDVDEILAALPKTGAWHPNTVELWGSETLRRGLGKRRPKCACFAHPTVSVLAVNRVQDVFRAPVYDIALGLDELNELAKNCSGGALDAEFYRSRRFESAHIGTVALRASSPGRLVSPSPAATIVIPARNASATIAAAVDSILRQTLRDIAVLVVDDGSTDDTLAVAASIVDPRLRVVANGRSPGVAGALNHGLALSRSPYVARLDADDECFGDDRLAAQREFLDANPDVGVLGGAVVTFTEDASRGRRVGRYRWHPCDPLSLAWSLHFSCHVAHPTVMARASRLRAVGGYSVRRGSR